jgi:hypothetical protein
MRSLRALLQFHAEEAPDQAVEAEFLQPEQPCGEHGVEHGRRGEPLAAVEQAQVVVAPVQQQFAVGQGGPERAKVQPGQRVHQYIAPRDAQLDQAQFLGVGMEAVSLGVERDPGRSLQAG